MLTSIRVVPKGLVKIFQAALVLKSKFEGLNEVVRVHY